VHELSLCEAILGKVLRHADGRPVTKVTVRIGSLRQVVPDALQFGWQMLAQSNDQIDADLVIEQVPAVVRCQKCGVETELDMPILMCGSCDSFDVDLLSGEEFLVVSLDLAEV
jgi:hydrogenase nickel incorporation protein HypA/HybF